MIKRIIAWFDKHFVSDWRSAWKWPEIQLAAAVPFIATTAAENWEFLLRLLNYLPANDWIRGGVISLLVISIFVVPAFMRLWDNEKKSNDTAG